MLGSLVAGREHAVHSLTSLAKVTGVTQEASCPCQPQPQGQRGHQVVTTLRPQPWSWATGGGLRLRGLLALAPGPSSWGVFSKDSLQTFKGICSPSVVPCERVWP